MSYMKKHWITEGTGGYKGLEKVTRDYKRLQ